jgi:hypothetical protein
MDKKEYELRKAIIDLRYDMKEFDKSHWFYKLTDKFLTFVENKLKKEREKK